MKENKVLDELIQDAIMETPRFFTCGKRAFSIYPLTLGKMMLMRRTLAVIGLDKRPLSADIGAELVMVVRTHKKECCEFLSYMTARNEYYDVFNYSRHRWRSDFFMNMDDGDVASVVAMSITLDRTEEFMRYIGIDREQTEMRRVMSKKDKDNGSVSFGGLSMYGTLIDVAMERYKMTKRQVVWEMDLVSLRLLLADRVQTVFLNEKERKRIRPRQTGQKVNGDDKDAVMRAIMSESWE